MTCLGTLPQAGDRARQLIGQAELLPAVVAQRTWSQRWAGRRVLLFMDNDSARHALIRGGSTSTASAHLVGLFWREETLLRAYSWIERVPTASNVADGPSRLDYDLLRQLGASWSVPRRVRAQELAGRLG